MNAAFLIMSSAALAGADPAPPLPPPAAPVVVSGAGCNNCGAPAYAPSSGDCCGSSKGGLFDRLKGRFGGGGGLFGKKHGKGDCGCAPACAPAPCPAPCAAPPPCNTCNPCATSVADRPNLLDTLKSRMGHKKRGKGDCGCAPACGPTCDPCGAAHLMPAPPVGPGPIPGPVVPPKEMPKPKDEKPKGGNTSGIPQPFPGAGLPAGASSSPY